MRAISGYVCLVPTNKTIAGATVTYGQAPTTQVLLKSTDGAGGLVFGSSGNLCTGITVRDMIIDGGRAIGGWGTQSGSCVGFAGQQDYTATPHNLQLINLVLRDGFTNQAYVYSVNGFTLDRVYASATTNPTVASHGCDFDAVAYDKPSKNGTIQNCDLDSYGQESMKYENSTDILIKDTTLRQFVTITQDNAAAYSTVDNITFRNCYIDAAINIGLLKRRHVPSQPANVRMATDTLTVSAAGTIGNTITGTSSPTAFTAGDVGKSVGPYSGFGTGFGIIESVTTGTATIRVIDVFANNDGTPLVFEANEWVLGYMDNSGTGSLKFERNNFGPSGLIWPGDGNSNNYGTQTINDNYFSLSGNSYKYPVGVTLVESSNANVSSAQKRFVRPTANAKSVGVGGTGVAGLNEGVSRAVAPSSVNTAIGYAVDGDSVWLMDGVYTATSGGANRSIGLGGKNITVRAENLYMARIDLSGSAGSSWQGIASSADVAGSLVWGIVFYGAGLGGGNGVGVSITGGSLTVRKCAAINCKTSNNGPGIKITGGSPIIEDYWVEGCDSQASSQGGAVNVVGSGSPVLRRGIVRNNISSSGAAGCRFSTANLVVDGLELTGNVSSANVGGIAATVGFTMNNFTAYGNSSATGACDISIANGITVTGDSWICYSTDVGSIKPVANGTTGVLILDKCTIQGGASAARFGNAAGANAWTNILSNDPQFIDATGLNLQLKSTSPCIGTGTAHAERWDSRNNISRWNTTPEQGAWSVAP